MLRVLADELRAHVAALRRHAAAFEADPSRTRTLRDARQRAHTIAASASLLGDETLVRVGEIVERTFELLLAYPADEQLRATLPWCVDDLDYLISCLAGGEHFAAAAQARATAASERLDLAVSLSGVVAEPRWTTGAPEPAPPASADVEPSAPSSSELIVRADGEPGRPVRDDASHLGLAPGPTDPARTEATAGASGVEDDLSLLPLDLDAALLETMRAETLGVIAAAREQVDILRVSPDDRRALRDLRGSVEAVAGAAGLAGDLAVAARATAALASIDEAAARGAEGVLAIIDDLTAEIDDLELTVRDGLLGPGGAFEPSGPVTSGEALDKEPPVATRGASDVRPTAAVEDDTVEAEVSAPPLSAELEALWEQVALDTADDALLALESPHLATTSMLAHGRPGDLGAPSGRGPGIDFSNVDPDILGIFLDEARGLLAEAAIALDRLRAQPARDHAETLRRCFHTLKGAAAMVGLDGVSGEAGGLERLIDHALEDPSWDVALIVSRLAEGARRLAGLLLDDAKPATRRDESVVAGLDPTPAASDAAPLEHSALAGTEPADVPDFAADELDDIRALFLDEAGDLTARLTTAFIALDRSPADASVTAEARRAAHTLKGAAAATGFHAVADLCHAMENLLDAMADGALEATEQVVALLFACGEELDRLVACVRADGAGAAGDSADSRLKLQILAALDGADGPTTSASDAARDETPSALPVAWRESDTATGGDLPALLASPLEDDRTEDLPAGVLDASAAVRVDIPRLDTLINLVGELVINRAALDQRLAQMRQAIEDLGGTAGRLRRIEATLSKTYEARELARADAAFGDEFDALEMDRYTELHVISRELTETVSDLGAMERELRHIHGELAATSARQARYSANIQDRLLGVRLTKLEPVLARAYRAGRDLARRQAKRVRVRVTGREVEVDRQIVEGLAEAMLHLIRNAVDHGVESGEARLALGKPEAATIMCSASREGNDVVVQIRDDGAGIDADLVHRRAIERGLVDPSAALTAQQKLELVFAQGLSTRDVVSDVSGRGVGLDVVRANVERLHGTVSVESAPGVGTAFIIRLPMSLAIARALLVRAGEGVYAVPITSVTELVRVAPRDVSRMGRQRAVRVRDDVFPLVRLTDLLGARRDEPPSGADERIMLTRTPRGIVAVAADGFSAQQEIVVKPLPSHLRAARGVTGATILGDGRVVLILDPSHLAGAAPVPTRDLGPRSRVQPPAPRQPAQTARPVALVVDDSLSIRRIVSTVLEAHGFAVVQAKDGADAAERLQVTRPRVVFLDVEMPRMNGFELLAHIRRSPTHRDLPVAMLTSRSGEHHRAKARELGVQAYLTKPSPDDVLVDTARRLAGVAAPELAGPSAATH